jgi:hypothetical protein
MNKSILLIPVLAFGCARTWVNYPPQLVTDKDGTTKSVASRAFELNGSDSLGATEIEVTRDGVKYTSAGGIDNSTSTKEGYSFGKHGITAGATVATVGFAAAAYAKEIANTSPAAPAPAPAPAPIPAGGSTIDAVVPATVVPVP